MPFDPDAIARLSPEARVEVQEFYARKFLAEREAPAQDRRVPKRWTAAQTDESAPSFARQNGERATDGKPERPAWPRVWFRNDSSRPTSFPHQWPPPFRPRGPRAVPGRSSK